MAVGYGRDGGDVVIRAVIFDMDGLLFDSEVYWERARRAYAADEGCEWSQADERASKGNNSREWATAMRDRCGLSAPLPEIISAVTERVKSLYEARIPLLPGAIDVVRELSARYPLGLASSSPPELIEYALGRAGIRDCFSALASSDEVPRGKPSPDVFELAARRLEYPASEIAVFEDSGAGIEAAAAASMRVFAVPNHHAPPGPEALAKAQDVLKSLRDFRPEML